MKERIILGFLKCFAALPLGVLYIFSDVVSFILYYLVKYRRNVVRDNLATSFPEKDVHQIKLIEKRFYRYLGDQMVETLKLLSMSDKALMRRVTVKNASIVNEALDSGTCAVILMGHYCNWEWVQEISRYFSPHAYMASIYHPLKDSMWDDIFVRLRSRWGAHILPMDKAPRALMSPDNRPWACGFIADAWTWRQHNDNHLIFLNHDTTFIYGPEEIGRKTGATFFYLEMKRVKRGHYEITFEPLHPVDESLSYPYTRDFWHKLEHTIRENPPYWLWSHKRWKK